MAGRDANNQNIRAEEPRGQSQPQDAIGDRDNPARERMRRVKGQAGEQETSSDAKGQNRYSEQDDRLAHFKAQMEKSFTRDDPGDRSR